MENQQGMILSTDDQILVETDRYSQTLRRALSLGLKQGDRDYRQGIKDTFPTKQGDCGEF
jgi:hypothetical protein